MSSRIAALLLLTSAGGLATCSTPPSGGDRRQNVVLVMTDDQGWGDLGMRGHPLLRTPHLDDMARNGVCFERFYSASPVCSPTRASVMTGRHPHRMGIFGANEGHLPDEEHTLAERLHASGYATGHFGKWHLGTLTSEERDSNRGGPGPEAHYSPPWEHGFETCFSTEAKVPTFDPMVTPPREHGGVGEDQVPGQPYGTAYWTGPGRRVTQDLEGDDSTLVMDRTLAFVDQAVREARPFLAVVWFHAPHLPIVADRERVQRFADRPLKERHYLASLEAVDDNVGRLRQHLRELGIERDTIVWFTSDNGPEGVPGSGLGSTGPFSGRKRSLKEGGLRVPSILEWPGRFPATRLGAPSGTIDMLPTVLSALDLPLPEAELDGIDLSPLLRGETTGHGRGMGCLYRDDEAWSGERWKILRVDGGPFALYDLELDPAEARDRAAEHPEIARGLEGEFSAWKTSLVPQG